MNPEIVSQRFIQHRRAAVFRAFSDPALLKEWWGPAGFTNEFDTFEMKPGGAWLFRMRAPDGTEHRMIKEIVEVVPPERIVVQHLEPPEHRFSMMMTFDEEDEGTRLTWRIVFESAEEDARVRPFIMIANEENFDRLEALLDGLGEGDRSDGTR
jgi:uncharacterized protein YndB with AHSA1/START domain